MDGSTTSGVYPVSDLSKAATSASVDVQKWKKCFDAKETLSVFESETTEAQSFGLGGTPGTLILNIKTGEYATVEGAYPYTTFTQKINDLMK
jgi:predicted DsbA family dithiol-disulfide isomerase